MRQSFCIRAIVDEQLKEDFFYALHAYYNKQNSFYLALYMLLIIGTSTATKSVVIGNNIIAERKTIQTLRMLAYVSVW